MGDSGHAAAIERKLGRLAEYRGQLEALVGRAGIPAGNLERRAAERLVQLVVEVAIDVNGLLAAAGQLAVPGSGRESFAILVSARVLPGAVAEPFITSHVGLRNRLVHDYDQIDHLILARSARRLLADSDRWAAAVLAWLRRGAEGTAAREPRTPYRKRAARKPAARPKRSARGA